MDGVVAKLETDTASMGCPEGGKPIVLSVKASELRKSFLERANKGSCGIGSILV
jgi:hypothetical protein